MITVLAIGWMTGMMEMLFANYTRYQTGNARIVSEGFPARERFLPVDEFIPESAGILDNLRSMEGIRQVEERIRFGLMLAYGEKTVHAVGMGLDLQQSEFDMRSMLIDKDGQRMPNNDVEGEGLYLGEGLAKKLGIQQGEKILLATRTSEGGLNGIKLVVTGFFRMGMSAYDDRFFFLSLENAKQLLKLEGMSTEIILFKEKNLKEEKLISLLQKTITPGLIVQSPADQLGAYYGLLKVSKSMYNVFMLFILFLASFVVMNTMMMSVLERVKEIGMLKSMGMTDRELIINFTLEGGIIGGIGGVLGTILGTVFVGMLYQTGVDMTDAVRGLDMPLESIIRPQIGLGGFLYCLVSSILVPAFASMIPAQYVKKFTPAEALRKI